MAFTSLIIHNLAMKSIAIILLTALLLGTAHETHGLTISGSSEGSVRVTFIVTYATTRHTKVLCSDFNFLEGLWTGRSKEYLYHVILKKGDKYSIEVQFSEVEPGLCEWRPMTVMYNLTNTNSSEEEARSGIRASLLVTEHEESTKGHQGQPVSRLTLRCHFEQKPSSFCEFPPGIWSAITTEQKEFELNFVTAQ